MSSCKDFQHDVLLIIISLLFFIFVTGIGRPTEVPDETIVIP
ncbi:MAG: hypothetical protein PHP06_07380 [Clostridia bacterium]|nr:hypothetical protein [Clostridia bacterium]